MMMMHEWIDTCANTCFAALFTYCSCDSCIERFYCSCYGGAWICSELAFRCGPCDATTTECPIIEDPSISPVPVGSCNVPQEKECTYGKTCWYVPDTIMKQIRAKLYYPYFVFLTYSLLLLLLYSENMISLQL